MCFIFTNFLIRSPFSSTTFHTGYTRMVNTPVSAHIGFILLLLQTYEDKSSLGCWNSLLLFCWCSSLVQTVLSRTMYPTATLPLLDLVILIVSVIFRKVVRAKMLALCSPFAIFLWLWASFLICWRMRWRKWLWN